MSDTAEVVRLRLDLVDALKAVKQLSALIRLLRKTGDVTIGWNKREGDTEKSLFVSSGYFFIRLPMEPDMVKLIGEEETLKFNLYSSVSSLLLKNGEPT